MNWRYFLAWLLGIPIAIINGSIRTYIYSEYLIALKAHQLSVLSFIILFGLYTWHVLPWLKIKSRTDSFIIGTNWVFFTVLFEFIFVHFAMSTLGRFYFMTTICLVVDFGSLYLFGFFLLLILFFKLRKKTQPNNN